MTDDRKLEQKWEKILKKHGLGITQPMTDNSEGELGSVERGLQNKDTHHALRQKMDGEDGFMEGHQVSKVRSMEREVPEWAMSDSQVQRILITAFPSLISKPSRSQRKRAARWARIIYLYYRMRLPRQVVAKEMGMTESALKSTIRGISRVASGKTYDGDARVRRHPSNTPVREPEKGDESIKSPLLSVSGDGGRREVGTKT